ncbi:undecaprenyl/decaprenyl-phosphate alpha-N-acetylglucosaminyl 1-phosphate transferase [Nocardioides sp. HDW12B]|uniref:glycosyltransferase family 4 protein n=1 Tax=Nocardioides sp. HDW12B TaxID=2714939 RepID=UPI00140C01B0|nr:MraY family glycosyltransferase [Nocardioides sp. HDW12B]QIK67114.1 undecaprenyl/decaprenyl-phosphate alpha-N-acetylglucosaminyl 1-phosphate transferase [Nocardioides sp. HDW12B]
MREYLAVFLVAVVVTYLLAVLARETALRFGAVARVRDRDVHEVPIPYFGGLALYGGLVAAYVVARNLPFLSRAGEQALSDAGVVLTAGGMVCALGVVDDLFEIDALTKLGGQVLAAGYMVYNDVQLYYLYLPGNGMLTLDISQAAVATVIIVVATVNAVNFVDGLDGLAAGVVGLGAVGYFLFSYRLAAVNGESLAIPAALLCAALAGGCLGFLSHNFHPAAMFMGDSGSMLIGLVLAGSALTLTANFPIDVVGETTQASLLPVLLPVLLPISILVLPFLDLLLAILRRTRKGLSPFSPDKQHLHHRLLELGHSHRRAVAIMWLWAALISLGGTAVAVYQNRVVFLALAGWLVVTVVLTVVVPRVERPGWTHHDDYVPPPPRR